MSLTLGKIVNNVASVDFEYAGEKVHLEYYPGRVTENIFSQLNDLNNIKEDEFIAGFESFNHMIASLVKNWDLFVDEAQTERFPIDPTRFGELPLDFRSKVFWEIIRDARPNQAPPQIQN